MLRTGGLEGGYDHHADADSGPSDADELLEHGCVIHRQGILYEGVHYDVGTGIEDHRDGDRSGEAVAQGGPEGAVISEFSTRSTDETDVHRQKTDPQSEN